MLYSRYYARQISSNDNNNGTTGRHWLYNTASNMCEGQRQRERESELLAFSSPPRSKREREREEKQERPRGMHQREGEGRAQRVQRPNAASRAVAAWPSRRYIRPGADLWGGQLIYLESERVHHHTRATDKSARERAQLRSSDRGRTESRKPPPLLVGI